ncbi:hypothetical protein G7072_06500 [Nocardioides sp. HDW12B]|nr:hypothetical protein [Nocardioides sp. HDW12B]QIK68434.1 hypothetical protein G7072_06500 [Nocardioides sp. HDW12B]
MESAFGSDRPSAQSTWWWRREDSAGGTVAPADGGEADQPRFPSQSDAETWVGETWRDLLDAGVEQVVLMDGDREVYGPMSLRPAGS